MNNIDDASCYESSRSEIVDCKSDQRSSYAAASGGRVGLAPQVCAHAPDGRVTPGSSVGTLGVLSGEAVPRGGPVAPASRTGDSNGEPALQSARVTNVENVLLQRVLAFSDDFNFVNFGPVVTGSSVTRLLYDALPRWRDQAKGESRNMAYRDGVTDETTDIHICMYNYMSPHCIALYAEGETSERSWQLCLRNALSTGVI